MRKFVGRVVKVETGGDPPQPVAVVDRDRRWEVRAVEREWFDTGHGSLPARAATWRTRRHRKNYVLLTADGFRLHVYFDYARAEKPQWRLTMIEEPPA
jgi:hypothetical protein